LKKCCCTFLNCSFATHLKHLSDCFSIFFHLFVPICSGNPDWVRAKFFSCLKVLFPGVPLFGSFFWIAHMYIYIYILCIIYIYTLNGSYTKGY
jgi:hypothetical protein